MLGIISANEIAKFRKRKIIIGIFIATGMDKDAIEWLQSSWEDIHKASGRYWHLLVPVKEKSQQSTPAGFNVGLSDELRGEYGIVCEQTPCIIFDNFDGTNPQLEVSLRGTNSDRKAAMLFVAEFLQAKAEGSKRAERSEKWRKETLKELSRSLTERKIAAFTKKSFSWLARLAIEIGLTHLR